MNANSKMAVSATDNDGLLTRGKAVEMVKEYNRRFAQHSPNETRYVSFPARRLFCFMYKMITDHNATDFRIYFSSHDENLIMRNPRIESPPNTDNYYGRTTLLVVGLKPNSLDPSILEEIIPDNNFSIDLNCIDSLITPKKIEKIADFATLCPPHGQHQERINSQGPPLSIYDEVYNT